MLSPERKDKKGLMANLGDIPSNAVA